MGNKKVNAYFADRTQASAAAWRLEALRASEVTLWPRSQGESGLGVVANSLADSEGQAADGQANFQLYAVVQSDIYDKALRIIEDSGGWI